MVNLHERSITCELHTASCNCTRLFIFPRAGNAGPSWRTCGDLNLVCFLRSHTRLWVRLKRPAFPAPFLSEGHGFRKSPGTSRRGDAVVCLRCERSNRTATNEAAVMKVTMSAIMGGRHAQRRANIASRGKQTCAESPHPRDAEPQPVPWLGASLLGNPAHLRAVYFSRPFIRSRDQRKLS